jgi:ABC-2 type transport system ATP-binding protein
VKLVVEVDEGAADLAADLVAAGFPARVDGPRRVFVGAQAELPYDMIRDVAATRGLALIRVEPARHRVEDLFRDDVDEKGANGTAA